jgi:hypothetical protein
VQRDFDDLKNAGANYVNFSVPGPYDVDGTSNAPNWTQLKQLVDFATKANLKIVIGFRTAPGRNEDDFIFPPPDPPPIRKLLDDGPDSQSSDQFRDMWKEVAHRLKNEPAVVGFDLLVEPHPPIPKPGDPSNDFAFRQSQKWPRLAKKAIDAIRSENAKIPILVEPDIWGGALYLNKTEPLGPEKQVLPWVMPDDDRLVCAIHQYNPSEYSESGKIPFDIDLVGLKDAFIEICAWRSRNPKYPACVNEFGVMQCLPYAELYLRKEFLLLKAQNLNHAVWLWQASDPSVINHDFDIRNRKVLAEVTANWRQNADGQRQSEAQRQQKTGPWPRDPHSGRQDTRLPTSATKTAIIAATMRDAADGCPRKTLYDPALKVEVNVADARADFEALSNKPTPEDKRTHTFALQKKSRRSRANSFTKPAAARLPDSDDSSRAVGYWFKKNKLLFTDSTAIRHVIVFPDKVGGCFERNLYATSTNRSAKGVEAHIAFDEKDDPKFVIWDWSLCDPRRIREVPTKKMVNWVFQVGGMNQVLVVNETRKIGDTTWINCVYLGFFKDGKLQRFDNVYSNSYALNSNDEQQPNCSYGFWGPEIETFQNYKQTINAVGFSGCWMIQDGKNIILDDSNAEPPIYEDFGLYFKGAHTPSDFMVD